MENKHGSGAKAGSLGEKGFYIVLFLCAAVIGVSVWMLLTDAGTNVENDTVESAADVSGAYVTMLPAMDPVTPPADVETMADAETAAVTEPEPEPEPEPLEDAATPEEPETQEVFAGDVAYIWPVNGAIQRPYAIQTLLYDSTMADWRTHDGVDITSDLGAPVMAVAGGVVVDVRSDDLLGTTVEVDHKNGIHSVYSNLAAEPPVTAGDQVTMGQVIGSVGQTALGEVNQVSHLHFAMRQDGITTDPNLYLPGE